MVFCFLGFGKGLEGGRGREREKTHDGGVGYSVDVGCETTGVGEFVLRQ